MASSSIYLSPRIILSYLKDLETKVPVVNKMPYEPIWRNNFRTDKHLEQEATSILQYVGLKDCVPTCKFDVQIGEHGNGFRNM